MGEKVTPHLATRVGEPGVQQQARSLDAAAGEHEVRAALPELPAVVPVYDRRNSAEYVSFDAVHHGVGPDLRPGRDGHGKIGVRRGRLGTVALALVNSAEVLAGTAPPVMGLVAFATQDGSRGISGPDPEARASGGHDVG